MIKLSKGLIHIYCGEGKGKTTSAVGLAVRALGSGMKVCIIQFLKSGSSEINVLKSLEPNLKVYVCERPFDFFWKLDGIEKEKLRKEVRKEFELAKNISSSNLYDLLVLDEILGAVENKLVEEDELLELLRNRNQSVEIVLTGRYVGEKILNIGDYVSKMQQIKHPFESGIAARKGIEY